MHRDPFSQVKEFLEKMGMEEKYRNKVFTSGEAALNYLKNFYPQKRFYHIGPT
jgi:ribonucleotide monophosphatase NagD (HAD superfamily)